MVPTHVTEARGEPEEVLKEITGAYGLIRIIKSPTAPSVSDEDIHSLVARVLLAKHKRLTSGETTA